jgi:O-acetylserine/cysteine efflux transporter
MSPKDILIALFVIFIWSINLVIQKIFSQKISLDFFNLLRFLSCVPLLFIFKRPSVAFLKILSVSLFWHVLTFFFVGLSLHSGTNIGTVSFVYQTCAFFGIFFGFLFLKEIPTISQVIGIVISFSGVALLFSHAISQVSTGINQIEGVIFTLFAAMSWGMGATLIKKFKIPSDLNTNIWITGIATLPMLGMIYGQHDNVFWGESYFALSSEILLGALYAGYAANVLGNCLWLSLLKKYPSSLVALFVPLLPFFSSILSYCFLEEKFTTLQLSAFLIIALGLAINQNLFKYLIKTSKGLYRKGVELVS